MQALPRQWQWWSLVAFGLAVFFVTVVSTTMQWRSLVRAGVAHSYVRMQLWVFVVMDAAMILFFVICFMNFVLSFGTNAAHLAMRDIVAEVLSENAIPVVIDLSLFFVHRAHPESLPRRARRSHPIITRRRPAEQWEVVV